MILKIMAVVVTLSLMVFPGALAASSSNPVKERQKLMRSVGKAMKTTSKMVQGKIEYDATAISALMQTMSDVAGKYTSLFPSGSDMENAMMDFDQESDAKPEIWTNMDDFKMKAAALGLASSNAMKLAADKAAFTANFGNVGKACKACHQKYKADKKE